MFGDVKVDEVTDVEIFKSTYFPQGFTAENAGYTVSCFTCKKFQPLDISKLELYPPLERICSD